MTVGSRNALTPLLTASTPVIAVQPLAKARNRSHTETAAPIYLDPFDGRVLSGEDLCVLWEQGTGTPGTAKPGPLAPILVTMEGFNKNPDGKADPWLGATDTFRFEERALLAHCGELIATRKFDEALRLVGEREHSFWLDRDVGRKAQWEACRRPVCAS